MLSHNSYSDPNRVSTVYVFQYVDDDNGSPLAVSNKALADGASHEVGHALGLEHHAGFDENGVPIVEDPLSDDWSYWDGTGQHAPEGAGDWAPLMGTPHGAERTTWWSNKYVMFQYQMLGLAQADIDEIALKFGPNEQGFVSDDHGDSIQHATSWSPSSAVQGIIRYAQVGTGLEDYDFFHVNLPVAPFGSWTIRVDVAQVGPNLDAQLEVYDAAGNLLGGADPSDELGASLKLGPGEYYIAVKSHGNYGDVGQYTLTAQQSGDRRRVAIGPPYYEIFGVANAGVTSSFLSTCLSPSNRHHVVSAGQRK